MIDASDMMNTAITVTIKGRQYQARQLSLEELFGEFQAAVKSAMIADAEEFASLMDKDDRTRFRVEAWQQLPTGAELYRLAQERMQSPLGARDIVYYAIRKDQPEITRDDLHGLLDLDTLDDLAPMISFLTGTGNHPEQKKKQAKKPKVQ